ncbi:MAG: hypothetical protein HYR79_06030 [Nitrospirae bacterium]|nr:hypothetical protein [Nitrospirota bacterium]
MIKLTVLFFAFILLSACVHSGPHSEHLSGRMQVAGEARGIDQLAKTYGVELVSLQATAGGQLLDLRYRVVKPELAKELFKTNANASFKIIDPKTEHAMEVPDTPVGKLKSKMLKPKINQILYVLFENPGGAIKPGSRVSLVIGSVRIDGVKVE